MRLPQLVVDPDDEAARDRALGQFITELSRAFASEFDGPSRARQLLRDRVTESATRLAWASAAAGAALGAFFGLGIGYILGVPS